MEALYYIDSLGAFAAAPVTMIGPAVAYNLTLLICIALSALAAQYLCEELSKPGSTAGLQESHMLQPHSSV